MPASDPDSIPASEPQSQPPGQSSVSRPGTNPSAPSASNYMPELPYAEELQALLEGRYIVESFLGQGGMGAVYRGLQMPLKRPVAIKILAKRQEGTEDEFSFEERFKREAYAMAALTHPNIVQVYDCGDAGESFLFISMELVEGGDLSDAIKNKLVTPEVALAMIGPICDGLQAAHDRGIVHRDIKPANIFLTADGKPKVADFGLAKKFDVKGTLVTKTGLGMGTPDYAAPEQYEGVSDIDHRADIYALGVMFYQMLTGRLPRGAYKPPSRRVPVDPRLDAVVSKSMQSDRTTRYQSTAEMKADIDQILATWMAAPAPEVTHTSAVPVSPRATGAVRPASHAPTRTSAVPVRPQTRVAQTQTHTTQSQSAPAKKSGAGMMIGVLGAVVVVAVGAFFLMKKPAPPKPDVPVATSASASASASASSPEEVVAPDSSSPTPPAPPAAVEMPVLTAISAWEDGLAKWIELVKGVPANKSMTVNADGTVLMSEYGGIKAGPDILPPPRDVAVRIRGRFTDSPESILRVHARQARVPFEGAMVSAQYEARLMRDQQYVRLSFVIGNKKFYKLIEWKLLPGFDPDASHTLELRAVGDMLTVLLDGQGIGSHRDSQLREGQVSVGGRKAVVEAFEYADLGAGSVPPYLSEAPLEFGGHRYDIVMATANWHEAHERATIMEGRLITINTREEQEWMERTLLPFVAKAGLSDDARFPLGAVRKMARDAWTWTTGAPMTFSAWRNTSGPDDPNTNDLVLDGICQAGFSKVVWDDVPKGSQTKHDFFVVEWGDDNVAPATPATPEMPVVAATPPLAGTVDLLALVDVQRDGVSGEWEKTPEGLVLRHSQGPQLLEIQQTPPEEYDFEIEYTPISGAMEAAQVVPIHSESMLWKMGCGGGFYTFGPFLDGKRWGERTEASVKRNRLAPNERHRSLLQVRKGSVRAEFDGEEVLNWSGDFTRFKGEPGFVLNDTKHLGLGSWGTEVIFHKAELRPASATAAAVAAAPMPAPSPAGTAASVGDPALITTDPRLSKLAEGFTARYEADAQQPFLTAVAALNKSYLANGVAPARAAAKAKGDLDAVTAFDEVKAKIEGGEGVPAEDPPGTPEPLKALRNLYRTALAKLEADRAQKAAPLYDLYLRALDGYVMELTKASKIAEASKVQKLRDDVAQKAQAEGAARQVASAAPANAPAAPPETPAPEDDAPSGSSSTRQLAEWVLSNGGTLAIRDSGGRRLDFKTGDKLPAGKLDIMEIYAWLDGVTDRSLAILSAAKSLEVLRLNGTKSHKLDFLRDLPKLHSLVATSPVVSRDSWATMGGLSRLQYLELLGKVEDEQIAQLTGLKELDRMVMENVPKGVGFAAMKESKKLRFLFMGGDSSELTDEGVRIIASTFPDLIECRLSTPSHPAGISNEGIHSLAPLKSLTYVEVSGKRIDDAALETFAKLRSLQRLNLGGTGIKGVGLGALSALGDLQFLSLRSSALTSAGLEEVAKLKRLNELGIEDTGVSDAAVKKLLEARPGLKVTK